MKAMTRQELADYAGVDRKTLYKWMLLNRKALRKMGLRPRCLLTPNIVEWIISKYGISID